MTTLHGLLGVIMMGLVGGACAPTTISPNWGKAYNDMRAKQTLNPTAGETLDPVEGQDGKVNAAAMKAYQKRFESPDRDLGRSAVRSGVQTR